MRPPKIDEPEPVVTERPERAVGVADIVGIVVRRRQIERGISDLASGDDLRMFARLVGHLAAPPEPYPAGALQGLPQRDRETSRPGEALARQGDPVGDDYEPRQNASSQLLLRRIAETMRPTIE